MQKFEIGMVLFAILVLSLMPISMAKASSQTTITMTSVGNTEIGLAWGEKDRMIRSWTEFTSFDPNDGYFQMKIIQQETRKVVSESTIQVMTSSVEPEINFNSFVLYMINLQDICQNEDYDNTMSVHECNPMTGLYEMEISTKDGVVKDSTTFTILDYDFA